MQGFRAQLLVCIISSWFITGNIKAQAVSIRLVQDETGYPLSVFDNNLHLQKKGFKIQVLLSGKTGVYVFASLKDSLYRLGKNDPFPAIDKLQAMILPEEDFNKNKELTVSDKGWSYWAYDPANTVYAFNKKLVWLDSGIVVGVKSIKQFYFPDEKRELKVKDIAQPLYLFFLVLNATENAGKPVMEYGRWKVKISWEKAED